MSSAVIEHKGIIVDTLSNSVKVEINAESACASCHAKGACSASDMEQKIIEVPLTTQSYSIGDRVMLSMNPSSGMKAMVYAYMIPFAILLIALIVFSQFYSELYAGVLSVLLLVPYYISLYLSRNLFVNKFNYLLKKL